jgi:replicative DNA helicase
VISDVHSGTHIYIVLQTYIARLLIASNRESISNLYKSEDPLETLDREYKKLEGIHGMLDKKQSKSIAVIVDENLKQAKHAMTLEDNVTGVPTGFRELDRATAGFQKSELIILAARPGMGKSGLMLSMAQSMAEKGFKVAIFSLEMSESQLVVRMQSAVAEISLESINSGRISNHEYTTLENQSKKIKALPIHIFDTPGMNLLELKSKCNQIKKKYGLDMIFVDYLQLMTGEKLKNNREQEIGTLSRGLKGLAKELDLPVIALSQLSRAVETRGGDKTPQLSDLRESGSIEQDADMVMFLYRPEYYQITEDSEGNSTAGVAKLIIAKHRQGRLLDVYMKFVGKFVKFTDLQEFGDVSDTNKELAERYSVKSPEKDDEVDVGDVPW